MKKFCLTLVMASTFVFSSGYAATLAGWDIPTATTTATSVVPMSVATGVTASSITLGSGLSVGSSSSSRWNLTSYGDTTNGQSAANGNAAGNYMAFQLTAASGYNVIVNGIGSLQLGSSGTGPQAWTLLYSSDSSFSSPSVVANAGNTGSTYVSASSGATFNYTSVFNNALSASPITITAGNTGYFRIVGWNTFSTTLPNAVTTTGGGTGGFIGNLTAPDFTILGDVNSLGMYTWTGGAGSWAPDVVANWQAGGASAPWINGKDATFASGGNLVIDPAGVSAGLLALSGSTPLTLTGGTLTASSIAGGSASAMNLNGGDVTVSGNVDLTDASISGGNLSVGGIFSASISTGSSTISTTLGGNGSLSKFGAGELILSRTNSCLGTTAVAGGTLTTGASEILSDTATLQVSSGATFKLGGSETVGGLNAIFGSFVNLQGNTLTAGGNNLGFTNGATITGTGGLVKNGTGQMYMNNSTNTFSGGFVLNSGDVAFTSSGTAAAGILSNSVFGTGTLTLNGGTITSSSATSGRTVYNNIVLNGNVQFGNSAWGSTNVQMNSSTSTTTNINTGVVTTNTNYTPLFTAATNTSATTTLRGDTTINTINWVDWYQPINGNFRITKSGTGALSALNNYLLLRASNNIAGVTVASGILSYKNRNALGSGTVILSNGVALAQDGLISNSPLTGNDQTDRAIPNNIRLDGDVTFGSLGQANHLGGNLDLNGGTSRVITLGNTTYLYGGVTNGGQLVIDNGTGTGSRTFAMFAAGNYTGGTVVRTNAALAVGHDQALGSGNLIFTNTAGSGVAILRASTLATDATQIRTITNNIQLSAGSVMTLDAVNNAQNAIGTNVTVSVDMVLAGDISGVGGLTKSNNNTVTLRGANSYSGATTIVNGNLVVITNNVSSTITSNTIAITFSNVPANGIYAVLPGALTGTYTPTFNNLSTSQKATFSTASPASVTVFSKTTQSITGLAATDAKTFGTTAYPLIVTPGASPSPLTFSSDNTSVATVSSAGLIAIVGAGSTTIRVNQAGDANYLAASEVTQVLTVAKATPSITVAPTASAVTVGAQLSTSNLSGGTASVGTTSVSGTYTWTTPSTVVSSSGSYFVTFNPTDSANYNTASTSASVTANPAGTTYSGWLSGNGGSASDAAFLDYVFGAATPGTLDPSLKPAVAVSSGNLVLTYYVRQGTFGLTVVPELSLDLSSANGGFAPLDQTQIQNYETSDVGGVSVQRRTATVPVSGAKKFLRVKAEQAP